MTVLIILAALAALYFLCGIFWMFYACARVTHKEDYVSPLLRQPPYRPYTAQTQAGKKALYAEAMEPVQIVAQDGKLLFGRLWECENPKGTVLLSHGYRSCCESDFSISAPYLHSLGYNLLLVNQRAHNHSQGAFITFGAKERLDAGSWIAYLGQLYGQTHPIFLLGISMGAATVLMASEFSYPENVRGILADCGYTTPDAIICHVAKQRRVPGFLMPSFRFCARLFAGFDPRGCSTVEAVAKTSYPILFVHGEADTFVPCEMTKETYAACRSEKELLLIPNAAHGISYLVDRPRVEAAISAFFEKHLGE